MFVLTVGILSFVLGMQFAPLVVLRIECLLPVLAVYVFVNGFAMGSSSVIST